MSQHSGSGSDPLPAFAPHPLLPFSCYTDFQPACLDASRFARDVIPRGVDVFHRFFIIFVALVCLAAGGVAVAQTPPEAGAPAAVQQAPASIAFVDGAATLTREGRAEQAVVSMPLVAGDRLRTEAGRVEVIFPDGSLLHVDRNTTADILSPSLVRLIDGRIIFVVTGSGADRPSLDYQVDAPGGSVRIAMAGEYRVSLSGGSSTLPTVALEVVSGEADLFNDQGTADVQAGERSQASEDRRPAPPQTFSSARSDAFERWSQDRRDERTGSTSTQYLPSELQPYSGTFDNNGRWDYDTDYGNVWYPTVAAGWRPYYSGYWDYVGPYGWTWIGYDSWAWPTHHYGRWGWGHNAWFWIPGIRWASAWVSWALASDYVSWCPLGFDDRPIFGWAGGGYGGYYGRRSYDPWLAWTIIPRRSFGLATRVASIAIRGSTLPLATRNGFAMHRTAPIGAPAGMARSAAGFAAGRQMPGRQMPGRAMPRNEVGGTAVSRGAPLATAPGLRGATAAPRGAMVTAADGRRMPSATAPIVPRASANRRATSSYDTRPGYATPRGSATSPYPSQYRQAVPGYSDSRPSYATRAPSRSYSAAPSYSAPRMTAPPSYSSPRVAAPSYSPRMPERAPSRSYSPSYSAPRMSAPSYSSPRMAAPSYSRSAPSVSRSTPAPRSAPSPRSSGGRASGGQARRR
jgi:hypothetical protein